MKEWQQKMARKLSGAMVRAEHQSRSTNHQNEKMIAGNSLLLNEQQVDALVDYLLGFAFLILGIGLMIVGSNLDVMRSTVEIGVMGLAFIFSGAYVIDRGKRKLKKSCII